MTSTRPQTSRHSRSPSRLLLGSVALVGVCLMLVGCGRKGAPEYDSGEPVVKSSSTNQLIPGLNLPQKSQTDQPKPKPKGNFILDPLL